MNKKKILQALGILVPTTAMIIPIVVEAQNERAISYNSSWLSDVTDDGFTINIKVNNPSECKQINVPVWRSWQYGDKSSYTATRVGSSDVFSTRVSFNSIGGGSEYIMFGVHAVNQSNQSQFLVDVSLKLDTNAPTLNVNKSNTNWTNQNIRLDITANDNLNIIEKINFYNKDNVKTSENLYSKPKILAFGARDTISDCYTTNAIKDNYDLTFMRNQDITSINQFQGYDIIMYDGAYWGIDGRLAGLLNQAFESGYSIYTLGNDSFMETSIIESTEGSSGSYVFDRYTNSQGAGSYYEKGRSDRISEHTEGVRESDGGLHKITRLSPGTKILSNVKLEDGLKYPGILYNTHLNGNKWIHMQKVFSDGSLRVIDELMHGTKKARQSYAKQYEISENGTYKVEVEDFSGNKSIQTIQVTNIDKEAPIMRSVNYNTNWAKTVNYNFVAEDRGASGISHMLMPDGTRINGTTANYTFTKNGTYQVQIFDNAGNSKIETVNVTNIDNSVGSINNIVSNITNIETSTSKRKLKFTFDNLVDSQSGIKGYSYVIDKKPTTIPNDTVNTNSNSIETEIVDTGLYYLHIKAIDNAGNVSTVTHHSVDIPMLTATPKPNEDMIRLDWALSDKNNKTFKVFQRKEGSDTFQSISTTNFDKVKQVKVLNIYPGIGDNVSFTTWDGENITIPKSGNLKQWMEQPTAEAPKGHGKGIIEVDSLTVDTVNANPTQSLKNPDGTWKYDVIYFGHWDVNNNKIPNTEALNVFSSFIEDGRGFLAGHDTIGWELGTTKGLSAIRENFNIKVGWWGNPNIPTDEGHHYSMGYRGNSVTLQKKGLLTNYPWDLGDEGTKFNVPSSHSTSNFAYGDIWMTYPDRWNDNELPVSLESKNNFYLTTFNNTAMIQTGHSNGNATTDEQKLLANTLFYLNQLGTDTYLDDKSGQDTKAPTNTTIKNHTINDKQVTINFNPSEDLGSNYEYYVESQSKTGDTSLSNVVKSEIKSGLKGYSYVVDNNATTIPDNIIDTTSTSITQAVPSNSFYVHIKSIDNVGNASDTVHYKIEDKTNPLLNITGNPTDWTNQNVILTATASDTGTGLQKIVLPNGNEVTGSSSSYTISQNGSYTFKAIDKMGNETIQTIVVDKIDKTISDIKNLNATMEMIDTNNSKRKLKISLDGIIDSQSGFKGYSYVLDKNENTTPNNTINSTSNNFEFDITDTGVYYFHIKAFDNAGNSEINRIKIDIPNLSANAQPDENQIRLDWALNDKNNKTFKVYQKKEGSDEFETISTTNLEKVNTVKVLNIYPYNLTGNSWAITSGEHTFTNWKGETVTLPNSASLKRWMEEPNKDHTKGYGQGIIEVDAVDIKTFTSNPDKYLKGNNSEYQYDVLMFGSWDSNGEVYIDDLGANAVKDFIESGKGVLFGHDTVTLGSNNGFKSFKDNLDFESSSVGNKVLGNSQIILKQKSIQTTYPWNIGDIGTKLNVPLSHINGEMVQKSNVFAEYDITPGTTSANNGNYLVETEDRINNYYLTTKSNVGKVQTGHSNGQATTDEQKILANTLFYLNQLSTDNFLNDKSGQDTKAPMKPNIYEHNYLDTGDVEFKFNEVQDIGSKYEYYVESDDTSKGNATSLSNVVKTEIKSGLKGYSYTINNNPNTVPDNIIEMNTAKTIKVKNNTENLYVHIKAIDNAGNSSETLHYKLSDITKPTLELTLAPNSWTNGNVTINAKATDSESGIKQIILPNGNIINNTTASFTVSANGIYYFRAIDRMGNETISSITVSNIDKKNPTVIINHNVNWTNTDVGVTITATDE